jgi:hypothetical protein
MKSDRHSGLDISNALKWQDKVQDLTEKKERKRSKEQSARHSNNRISGRVSSLHYLVNEARSQRTASPDTTVVR